MTNSKNVPKSLEPVVNRWLAEKKDFFLGPENLFRFDAHPIQYLSNPDIPAAPGSWFCDNRARQTDPIRELTTREVQDLAMELAKHHKPTRWTISLDYHCNYDCPMCPYHGTGYEEDQGHFQDYWDKHASQKRVVTKEEAFETIDILVENGIKILSLQSAGELFLYPHWKEVALYAGKKGFKLWGITNGSMVDENVCKILKEAGFSDMRVSLDAVSFEVYSQIRSKRRDFYERAMAAPRLLQKHGIKVNVHFVKQEQNLHEREAFLDYWKQTDIGSISIANQFVYNQDGCFNKFEPEEKPPRYIHGICTKYGNFASWHDGTIIPCCGTTPIYTDNPNHALPKLRLQKGNFKDCLQTMNRLMSEPDSPIRRICATCSLYTAYSTEKQVDGWKVSINPERETWEKI